MYPQLHLGHEAYPQLNSVCGLFMWDFWSGVLPAAGMFSYVNPRLADLEYAPA